MPARGRCVLVIREGANDRKPDEDTPPPNLLCLPSPEAAGFLAIAAG